MIRVQETSIAITKKNIAKLISLWITDLARLKKNDDLYTNKADLKIPYAKKLVTISAAATLGDGITLSAPDDYDETQKATFEELLNLYKKQTIINHDLEIIVDMCKLSRSYELCYMSNDEKPIPKVTVYSALNAFVVYDNTVENNSLLGCYLDTYISNYETVYRVNVVDSEYQYSIEVTDKDLKNMKDFTFEQGSSIDNKVKHNMGRVPLTEIRNNKEEQSDFEQVISLMEDRTAIHDINIKDFKEIAKNYIKGRNVEITGATEQEKAITKSKMADNQIIEIATDGLDANDDISIMQKMENYSSIDIMAKDIEQNIYDKTMIPDLSSEEFAGNQSGVALKVKLSVFKEMVKSKTGAIEKMYRRRNKMYVNGLVQHGYAEIDASEITITINRSWAENELDIAQLIQTLSITGLYSDRYLTNKMPDADYEEEQAQLSIEREEKAKIEPKVYGFDNSQGADYLASFRSNNGEL